MAFETINFDRCIAMAADTEVILDRCDTASFLTGVAIDTFLKAVFLGAYTFDYRLVTVSIQYVHVVAPHELGGFHALLTLNGFGDNRLRCALRFRLIFRPSPSQGRSRQHDHTQRQELFQFDSHA